MKHLKLKTQLNISFLVLLLIPMVCVAIYAIIFFIEMIRDESLRKMDSDMKVAQIIFENAIDDMKIQASNYARKKTLKLLLHYRMERKLSFDLAESAYLDGIDMVTVIGKSRQVLLRAYAPAKIGMTLEKTQYIDRALMGESVGGVELMTENDLEKEGLNLKSIGLADDHKAIVLTGLAPIYDRFDELTGAVIVRKILNNHPELLQHLKTKLDADTAFFEHTHLIASIAPEKIQKEFLFQQEALKSALNAESYHLFKGGDILKYAPILDFNGIPVGAIALKTDIKHYLQAQSAAVFTILSIFIIILFHNLFIKYLVKKRFVLPLEHLKEKIKAIDGHNIQPLEIEPGNELGDLTAAFNEMTLRLNEKQSLLSGIMSATNNAIHLIVDRRYIWSSPRSESIFGWKPEEMKGKSTRILYPNEEEYIRMGRYLYGQKHKNGVITFEYEFLHKDGRRIPCLVNGQAIDENDLSRGYVFSLTDINEIKIAERKIRNLTRELLRTQENERKRIAYDLHDDVAQQLSSIILKCKQIDCKTGGYSTFEFINALKKAVNSIRKIAYGLRPSILDYLGLSSAFEQLFEDFHEETGIPVHFSSTGIENLKFDSDMEIQLFRVAQEALNNVKSHARADNVYVKLLYSYPKIMMRIVDDGVGFNLDERAIESVADRRMGIQSMMERISFLEGDINITSVINQGTKISIEVTCRRTENEKARINYC